MLIACLFPFYSFIYRWDIIAERLGFMLVFGDLVFIPFTFSIQVLFTFYRKRTLCPLSCCASCRTMINAYCMPNVVTFPIWVSPIFFLNFSIGLCFTYGILFQGWWLLQNKVELPNVAAIASCLIFVVGYNSALSFLANCSSHISQMLTFHHYNAFCLMLIVI